GLEALGPAIAKLLIDHYLLPRNAQIPEIAGLLLGALAAGMAASWLRSGQLVSRVTNDTEAVKTLYVQVLFVMLDSLIVLTGTMIAMLWLEWRLMLVVAGLFPA